MERKEYRYYKAETRGLDLDGLLEDLKVGWDKGMAARVHPLLCMPRGEGLRVLDLESLLEDTKVPARLHHALWAWLAL